MTEEQIIELFIRAAEGRNMPKYQRFSPALMRELLSYDPSTGALIWKPRCYGRRANRWNAQNAGKTAGTKNKDGYLLLSVYEVKFMAHVVAWAIVHGEWPSNEIDHENGIPSDNRIGNLRLVEHAINQRNMKRPANNTSGCIGVRKVKRTGNFEAYIKRDGRNRSLGTFASLEQARQVRLKAQADMGFHHGHGR